jgi:hypothetical protein
LSSAQKSQKESMLMELLAELLRRGKAVEVRARGGSMHPIIRDGDRVRIEPVRADELRAGDIIAYRRGGRLFVHRYLGRWANSGAMRTRGDSHSRVEPPLDPSEVLGRVTAVGRYGKQLRLSHASWRTLGLLLQPLFARHTQLKEWLRSQKPS